MWMPYLCHAGSNEIAGSLACYKFCKILFQHGHQLMFNTTRFACLPAVAQTHKLRNHCVIAVKKEINILLSLRHLHKQDQQLARSAAVCAKQICPPLRKEREKKVNTMQLNTATALRAQTGCASATITSLSNPAGSCIISISWNSSSSARDLCTKETQAA